MKFSGSQILKKLKKTPTQVFVDYYFQIKLRKKIVFDYFTVRQGTLKSYQNKPLQVLPERQSDLIHLSLQPGIRLMVIVGVIARSSYPRLQQGLRKVGIGRFGSYLHLQPWLRVLIMGWFGSRSSCLCLQHGLRIVVIGR